MSIGASLEEAVELRVAALQLLDESDADFHSARAAACRAEAKALLLEADARFTTATAAGLITPLPRRRLLVQHADILCDLGVLTSSIPLLERALALAPSSSAINYHLATLLRAAASHPADLLRVEKLLNAALANANVDNDPVAVLARDALILLLCQQDGAGAERKARDILTSTDYTIRLAPEVLNYRVDGVVGPFRLDIPFVKAIDDCLPQTQFHHLRSAFGSNSRFWSEHCYSPMTPYFSYIHDVKDCVKGATALDQILTLLWTSATSLFPSVKNARYVEWWAHCRPHSHGHQLHFDSDNEGHTRVNKRPRHPIASSVIYLTEDIGGPTLVTNQSLDSSLADRGWLVAPRLNRYVVFDGRVLHGVIPGTGVARDPSDRRISFMAAFWDSIKVKHTADETPGPSRPYPRNSKRFTWPDLHKVQLTNDETAGRMSPVKPIPVPVWVSVEPSPTHEPEEVEFSDSQLDIRLSDAPHLPHYSHCFQGF